MGIGEAVTGANAGRAIEPAAGEGGDAEEGACRNCRTRLVGRHCHECGQPSHVHRSVSAWWHDVAHSVLHFEGKIWRTLPLLAWRPGELTRRYIAGERAKFVSPMASFLFTVFLMFAVFSLIGASIVGLDGGDPEEAAPEVRRAEQRIRSLEAERQVAVRDRSAGIERIDAALREARMERDVAGAFDGEGQIFGGTIDTGWARLDKGLGKANENPALLGYKLQTNAYKFSWALIPISLPFRGCCSSTAGATAPGTAPTTISSSSPIRSAS